MSPAVEPEKRVPLADVKNLILVGEALPFRVLDPLSRLLLSQGQRVQSEHQLEQLLERGAWIEYEAAQQLREKRAEQAAEGKGPVLSTAQRQMSLFDRWEQTVWGLDALLRKVGREVSVVAELDAFADELLQLVRRDVDVALFMSIRQDDRRFALYALTHSLHTATLAALAGERLGWSEAQLGCVVRAALTMNVSMMELQATMAEQAAPPTPRQLDQIRTHPERSVQMLRNSGVEEGDWLGAVHDHHEQPGGKGYPRGLAEVGDLARVLRTADVFMAKVTPRALRPALAPQVAARDLYQQEGGSPLANAVIKSIGVHPPGELVQLRSGEIAIVTRRAAKGPSPMVATLSNKLGQPTVATNVRDTSQPEYAIVGAPTDRGKFARVLPERVYGLIDG